MIVTAELNLNINESSGVMHPLLFMYSIFLLYCIRCSTESVADIWGRGNREQSSSNNFRLAKCNTQFFSSSSQEAVKNQVQVSALV